MICLRISLLARVTPPVYLILYCQRTWLCHAIPHWWCATLSPVRGAAVSYLNVYQRYTAVASHLTCVKVTMYLSVHCAVGLPCRLHLTFVSRCSQGRWGGCFCVSATPASLLTCLPATINDNYCRSSSSNNNTKIMMMMMMIKITITMMMMMMMTKSIVIMALKSSIRHVYNYLMLAEPRTGFNSNA